MQKNTPQIGKTPEGKIAAETPASRPRSGGYGTWGSASWLGDPEVRYGRRTRAWDIANSIKLEMMNDPVIGLCFGFIAAKLANAEWEIACADPIKKRFFEAMYERMHHTFILQAAPAILFGSLGLIKQFKFMVPRPFDPLAPPVWTAETTPYIITGFDQLPPGRARPRFTKGRFDGIDEAERGHIDVFYSLWMTLGKARAFGAYRGHGRLCYVYPDWWLKQFARDLLVLHLQKSIDRVIMVGHPEGKHTDGRSYREIALGTGDDIRAGATVALPTSMYSVPDPVTGQTRPTSVRQWQVDVLEGAENVEAFHELDDHLDQKISLGMFVPPQVYLNVRQSALGGPTTADVLGELAVDLLLLDATDIDNHINSYVFRVVDRMNFPPGSPPVEKRTVGLIDKDRQQMFELIKILAGKLDSSIPYMIDAERALNRLGIPTLESPTIPPGGIGERLAGLMDSTGRGGNLALQTSGGNTIPQEILERIATEALPDDADKAAIVTEADVERVVARLKEEIPELFDREI